jgi:hypothetical protein
MKARICPHCQQQLKIEQIDYCFSENLSLMCVACNKAVFPTDSQSELDIDLAKRMKPNQQVYQPTPQQQSYPYHQPPGPPYHHQQHQDQILGRIP